MDEDQVSFFPQVYNTESAPRVDIHCQHPQKFISKILRTLAPNAEISIVDFPINYPQDNYGDFNTVFAHLRLSDIKDTAATVESLATIVSPRKHEIGIGSRIKKDAMHLYIPMIDFTGKPEISRLRTVCESLMHSLGSMTEYRLYDSGNSYHAYFGTIITFERLTSFLRELTQYPEVDQRWVAHSRRSQTGPVLRWTSISGHKGVITEVGGLK